MKNSVHNLQIKARYNLTVPASFQDFLRCDTVIVLYLVLLKSCESETYILSKAWRRSIFTSVACARSAVRNYCYINVKDVIFLLSRPN